MNANKIQKTNEQNILYDYSRTNCLYATRDGNTSSNFAFHNTNANNNLSVYNMIQMGTSYRQE